MQVCSVVGAVSAELVGPGLDAVGAVVALAGVRSPEHYDVVVGVVDYDGSSPSGDDRSSCDCYRIVDRDRSTFSRCCC